MRSAFSDEVLNSFYYKINLYQKMVNKNQEEAGKRLFESVSEDVNATMWGIENKEGENVYFGNEDELLDYIDSHNFTTRDILVKVEYFPSLYGATDIFKVISYNGFAHYYTAFNYSTIGQLDILKSLENGDYCWIPKAGSIEYLYENIKEKCGVVFTNNPYDNSRKRMIDNVSEK